MTLTPETIESLQQQTALDCLGFWPELTLCAAIIVMLLLRLVNAFNRLHLAWVALVFTLGALAISVGQWQRMPQLDPGQQARTLFAGLLAYDHFTLFLRLFLFGFTALVIWLSMLTGIPDREDSADFYCLLLGATIGMSIMASANHLLMVYIGVEMASLPSYALAGFLKGKRQSSEAALKYVVFGGGASGIMLYGISLLAGKFGTAYLPVLAERYVASLAPSATLAPGFDPILLLGTLFILIGIAFKLAAVPFHFWCPDVFEGASAEVAGYLSVASKGAALALLGRLVLVLAGPAAPPNLAHWSKVAHYLLPALAVFAALTATFGNFAAYRQTNLKRLLAYSTIAHAGYMLMGLTVLRAVGASAVLFYLVVYLFMNLGAFAIVAFLRNLTGSEDLASFRGLLYRAPFLVVTLAIFLLSLLGLPPLAGFAAKWQIFQALWQSGQDYWTAGETSLGTILIVLLVIGGINTVLSAFYYLNVLRVMILERPLESVEGREPAALPAAPGTILYAGVMAAAIFLIFIVWWDPLDQASQEGAKRFKEATPRQVQSPRDARGLTVLDAITQTVLQGVFRRESRSLLQYASESYPWTSLPRRTGVDKLRQVIASERRSAGEVARFLARHGAPLPYVGAYPSDFTTVNDVALDYLARLLVQHQRRAIAALERDVAAVTDTDARALLERILKTKREHLATLDALAAPEAAAAVT